MSKWGAIAGAAQAGGQALNTWLSFEMEKQKEQRLQAYADQRYQQQRADQLEDKTADREYAKGILSEERQYQEGRDAKKHEQALELAKQKGQVKLGDKADEQKFEALKLEYGQLSKELQHFNERLGDPMNPLSEEERSRYQYAQKALNQVKSEMYRIESGGASGKKVFDVDAAVSKLSELDDAKRAEALEQIRARGGDDAVRQVEARLGAPGAGNINTKPVKDQNNNKNKIEPGILKTDELKPHQRVIQTDGDGKRGILSDIFAPDPNDPRLEKDQTGKHKFESNVAVGRFMTKYADGKRTPSYTEVTQVLPYVNEMSPEERQVILSYAAQYGIK